MIRYEDINETVIRFENWIKNYSPDTWNSFELSNTENL